MAGGTEGFARQLDDCRRHPGHSLQEMVRSRVFGILAGYEDQNDHGALRTDAVFKLLARRLPEDDDLASQSTWSRSENAITVPSLLRLEECFIDRFVNSFDRPPRKVTLDIDVFEVDPPAEESYGRYLDQDAVSAEARTAPVRRRLGTSRPR